MEKTTQQLANSIAHKEGYGIATKIKIDKRLKKGTGRVTKRINFGYRKNTTDQYVPNAYMNKFGWKNCYYQKAETVVTLNL